MHREYSLHHWAIPQVHTHSLGLLQLVRTSTCSDREVQATSKRLQISRGACVEPHHSAVKLLYLHASKQILLKIITVLLVLEDGHNSLCEGSWVECDCDVPLASLDLHAAAKADQP